MNDALLSSKRHDWRTPKSFFESVTREFGQFDTDAAASADNALCPHFWDEQADALKQDWAGRKIWCNPPYGKYTKDWLNRMILHNNGIALTFARIETKMFFQYVWGKAMSVIFIEGRLFFYRKNGIRAKANSGAPSVLIAYGKEADKRLLNSKIKGKYIRL